MSKLSLRRKDGQVSVLVAVCMGLVMVMVAFGIDIAHVLVEKRHAQNAADAAALAAGRYLPFDDAGPPCVAIPNCKDNIGVAARDYSQYNGGPAGTGPLGEFEQCTGTITTNCYDTPYKGHKYLVQIRIHEPVKLWFAGAVPGLAGAIKGVNAKAVGAPGGVTGTTTTPGTTIDGTTIAGTTIDGTTINGTTNDGTTVDGTTIAGTTSPGTTIAGTTVGSSVSTNYSTTVVTNPVPGGPGGAVGFVMSTRCPDAISYTGAGGGTIGALMTNGGATLLGASKTVTSLGVGRLGTSGCYTQGPNVTVNQLYGPFSVQDWPLPIPIPPTDPSADCTHNLGSTSMTFTKAGNPPGVYCLSAGTLTIGGNGVDYSGYTFIAPTIVVSATNSTFSPASGQSTVFYNSGGNSLNIQDTSATWTTSNTISGTMCLGTGGLTFAQAKHPKGVYCLTGPTTTCSAAPPPPGCLILSSNGADFRGYTFYSPSILVNSNSQQFSPAAGQTAVVDAYLGSLTLNGNGNTMSGNIFAPDPSNGAATINGGALGAGSGYIEVQTLSISGNFANFTGTGPGGGGTLTTSTETIASTTTYPGTTNPGTTIAGTTSPSTTTPGTTNAGTTTPGSTTPGTTNPDITVPGTTTPGSTNTVTTGTTVALNE